MSRKHKRTDAAALLHAQDYVEPPQATRKKKDSRSFFPSQNGKAFCVFNPDGLGGTARSANGKTCCVFELQKDGDRVISIHAGDVLFRKV